MSVGNKKVTQLVALTATEVAADDLFYIVDVTAKESKKILASELATYLSISGSLYVLFAQNAGTASYVLGNNVVTPVASASFALFSMDALSASWAQRAGFSSLSETASYAQTVAGGIGFADSASWASSSVSASYALKASNADNAAIAAFLYYSGTPNGTASWAISSSVTARVITADTASYINTAIGTIASASYADRADHANLATQSITSYTASFLEYSPENGTASYAIRAGSIEGVMNNYGLFDKTFQYVSSSGIDILIVSSSLGGDSDTVVSAIGNVLVGFTSSLPPMQHSLSLFMQNRLTGESGSVDESSMYVNIAPSMGVWGSPITGTVAMPFHLAAQVPLNGQYLVRVDSSSPDLVIDNSRTVRFGVMSYSDVVQVSGGPALEFYVTPTASVTLSFYVTGGSGPFTDQLPGLIQTGSAIITHLDFSAQTASAVGYTWRLTNILSFICDENEFLTKIDSKFAPSLLTMSCRSCNIAQLPNFNNTTASYLNFENNQLRYLPELSISTSFLDFSNNPVLEMPAYWPPALEVLSAYNTLLSGSVPMMPDTLRTASFRNTIVDTLPDPLPASMSYLDVRATLVATMSYPPISMSYLDISYAQFNDTALDTVTTQLVANGYLSGTLDIRGYGVPSSPTLIANLGLLQDPTTRYWTIYTD